MQLRYALQIIYGLHGINSAPKINTDSRRYPGYVSHTMLPECLPGMFIQVMVQKTADCQKF